MLGVAIWGSPEEPKHSTLTLLRSGLWAAPVRLGIPAWRRRQALAPVLAALKPPGPCWYLNGIGVDSSAQRTGLGSALINQMLPRIDDGFCQNSGLSRHGGKLTQKLGPG